MISYEGQPPGNLEMSEAPGGTPSTAGRSTAPSTSLQHDDEVPDPDEDDLDDLDGESLLSGDDTSGERTNEEVRAS